MLPPRTILARWLLLALLLTAMLPACLGVEIDPPFKLSWGENTARLERLVTGAGAKIVARRPAEEGADAWEVEGITQEGLKKTIFYFKNASLTGVELQYRSDAWPQEKYDDFMTRWRRSIEQRYGEGQLIARKTEPLADVLQTVVGYKWNQNNTSLELIYYAAKSNSGQVFRTLSVHYKGG